MYIVSEFGEDVTISILCNHTRGPSPGWFVQYFDPVLNGHLSTPRQVPPFEESILIEVPNAMTTYYMANDTLFFNNPAPEMQGVYSCALGELGLRITLSKCNKCCDYRCFYTMCMYCRFQLHEVVT